MTVVVPPEMAPRVPVVQSSAERALDADWPMWTWESTPPG
jgi:hypothetical protein